MCQWVINVTDRISSYRSEFCEHTETKGKKLYPKESLSCGSQMIYYIYSLRSPCTELSMTTHSMFIYSSVNWRRRWVQQVSPKRRIYSLLLYSAITFLYGMSVHRRQHKIPLLDMIWVDTVPISGLHFNIPSLTPMQWTPRTLSSGIKRAQRKADHSPPFSDEVKKAWSFTSTPPIRFHDAVLSEEGKDVWLCVIPGVEPKRIC